jgi:hypothetical protein
VETALDALVVLARRYAFGEVAALLTQLPTPGAAELQRLCAFGQRLIDLDAEDFGDEADHEVPLHLQARALACRMPQSSREKHRGALGSLKPAYQLLLEVIDARFRRRETTAVVATVHIASEYAPLLVWERVLGHSGDPARIAVNVGGEGSSWGDFDDRECAHTKTLKSATKRSLTVAQENALGWRNYLDRQHSHVSHAFAVCAVECRRPCTVYTRLSTPEQEIVRHGSRLAQILNDSAIVRLRHSAPVGHGFGVPSPAELLDAWDRTRESLGRTEPSVLEEDGYPLPGFANLVTALAGQDLPPGTLLADTAEDLTALLQAGLKGRA